MMSTIDVPQTNSLIKYIEKKDFKSAYKVACLGVTEQDFRYLGSEALINIDFDIANKVIIMSERNYFMNKILNILLPTYTYN